MLEEFARAFTRDVEVTRRLYRSGESEYLIDGEVCRLRDVHELLMDTGLGAKAYAIIEQGKIGMILSSRPADRRQLIEEAAGITKYKSRRRAAELKLEAAQQNLTRIDDIVFEVEKQRGTLKRQAAKARRYKRLRDELRRWEKVLFARRYRELAHEHRGGARDAGRRASARAAAAARLAEVETELGRLRIEQAEADDRAATIREDAHARELDINRRQQQLEFNRHQAETLDVARDRDRRRDAAISRRGASRRGSRIESRRGASTRPSARGRGRGRLRGGERGTTARAQQQIEASSATSRRRDARCLTSLNSVTALRHAMEHAAAQHERVGETLGKLDVEEDDLRREQEARRRARGGDRGPEPRAGGARIGQARSARRAKSELASARGEHEGRAREVRTREQELAAVEARLASLQELATSRADFGDAARMVLVQANGHVGQQGAVADYLDVDSRYERAVEACLGDLLQHVIVERHDQAAAGLSLVREHDAGRCGFVVVDPGSNGYHPREALRMPGIVPVADVLRVAGPHAITIQKVLPEAYVADTFEQAVAFSRQTSAPIATLDGDVFRGPHLVSGGAKAESRGILATRREIKELRRARRRRPRGSSARLAAEVAAARADDCRRRPARSPRCSAEQHRRKRTIVGSRSAAVAQPTKTRAPGPQGRSHRPRAAPCRRGARRARGAAQRGRRLESIGLESEQHAADERLGDAQRRWPMRATRLAHSAHRPPKRAPMHAGLVERAAALAAEVAAARGRRARARAAHRRAAWRAAADPRAPRGAAGGDCGGRARRSTRTSRRSTACATSCAPPTRLRRRCALGRRAGRRSFARRGAPLEAIRAEASELEVARATAESDLTHLAQTCVDARAGVAR